MANQSTDWEQLYRQSEIQRRQAELQRQQAELQRQQAEDENQQLNRQLRSTTLLEYLDACHVHFSTRLKVEKPQHSTQGSASNAEDKVRPVKIRRWANFMGQQKSIWTKLIQSDAMGKRIFDSLEGVAGSSRSLSKPLSSEPDLHTFESVAVGHPVASIIKAVSEDEKCREEIGMKGFIQFENHANLLNPDDTSELPCPETPVLAQIMRDQEAGQPTSESSSAAFDNNKQLARPRADQFCFKRVQDAVPVIVCVGEFKAPHKLTLENIENGLEKCDLEDVVARKDGETLKDVTRRLVAAIICQTYSYMIQAGLRFGYVSTGQAFIYLQVPENPQTVYYHLSVPYKDVGQSTGWSPDKPSTHGLRLTAVAQLSAFLLRALQHSPRPANWIINAMDILPRWNVVVKELIEEVSVLEATPSAYAPSPRAGRYLRTSPVVLRPRNPVSGCKPPSGKNPGSESSNDDDVLDPDTPSRRPPSNRPLPAPSSSLSAAKQSQNSRNPSRHGKRCAHTQKRSYCSHQCLAGLASQGPIDPKCPNAQAHGVDRHRINQSTLLQLLHRQLALDVDSMENLGIHGSRGAIFRITLTSDGYTMLAKCSPIYFARRLQHEATVYNQLRPIQGVYVPVCLGVIPLDKPYPYYGVVNLSHMLLLSFGGQTIDECINLTNQSRLLDRARHAMQEMHQLGVLHHDAAPRNVLYNAKDNAVMIIDFERAWLTPVRTALSEISSNPTIPRAIKGGKHVEVANQELSEAMTGLSRLECQ